MRTSFLALALLFASPALAADWAIAIHGGAGVIERGKLSAADDAAIRAALGEALDAGSAVLNGGGAAVDAVVAAVTKLEESPWFNAGVGAVLTSAGTVELDAAIMDGASRRAGAVTGVKSTRSPIALARTLMDKGPHVFLAGDAPDAYAIAHGLPQVPNSHFLTPRRVEQLKQLQMQGTGAALRPEARMGTVGAVARDVRGNLAAGTSTGGLTGKAPGRVGDAPVIGAGTLANNSSCAVSATGSGEIFIRAQAASQVCAKAPLQAAADATMADIGRLGGDGGLIALSQTEGPLFALNSTGMYRGRATASGIRNISIYGDE